LRSRAGCRERRRGKSAELRTGTLRVDIDNDCTRDNRYQPRTSTRYPGVELQVIPATVRIQSGALRASRPGNGAEPGRTYRIRRTDLDAFVAASQSRPADNGA